LSRTRFGPSRSIERDQPGRLRIGFLSNLGIQAGGVQPIDQSCEQDRTCAIDALEVREIDINPVASMQV